MGVGVGVGVGVSYGSGCGCRCGCGFGCGCGCGCGCACACSRYNKLKKTCLVNSHKHQNNIIQKETSIKINNYLPGSINITCMTR